jgi:hypothetical protein
VRRAQAVLGLLAVLAVVSGCSSADESSPLGIAAPPATDAAGATPVPGTPTDGTTAWAPAPDDSRWVNVKDHGAVGDGVADDTAAFRSAAATGKMLFVPAPPAAYKLTGVVRLANSVYGDGSMPEIRMHGADGDPDQGQTRNIFYVYGYQGPGLVIQGVHLNGQWNGGGNGEWGHAVNIGSSSNVTVQHCRIEAAYGDDVFVGEFSHPMADNIVIQNNVLGTARRCNVAVSGATNVFIRNNTIEKTGSTYVSAIDLEPDELGFQYVRNVTIDGNVFDVVAQEWSAGAISMNNPAGNPASGDVSVTNNRGRWTPTATYMDIVPGSSGLIGVVPHLPWYNVTAANNTRE